MTSHEPVEFWFDPLCPWAWLTSRWLRNAAEVRDLDITWSVMSLAVLNEGRGLQENYRAMMDKAWGPVRVAIAASERHGAQVLGELYTQMGARIHHDERKDWKDVVIEALAACELSADLIEAYDSDDYDDPLRASHKRAIDLVGDDVGTPVISAAGTAFFGPVVSPAPTGEAADKLWDGVLAVAQTQGFFELKRTRNVGPIFDESA